MTVTDPVFIQAQAWLARAEGRGFTNDPDDDGGPTKAGMTEPAWHEWQAFRGRPLTAVEGASAEEIAQAYFDLYWAKSSVRAVDVARISWPIGLIYYDSCVVQGRGFSPAMLQRAVRVDADGRVGPRTLAQIQALIAEPGGETNVVRRMLGMRRDRFLWCVQKDPTDRKYVKGWLNRLIRLRVFLRQPRPEWEANDKETYGCEVWA